MKFLQFLFLCLICVTAFSYNAQARNDEMFTAEDTPNQKVLDEIKEVEKEIEWTQGFIDLEDFVADRIMKSRCKPFREKANEAAKKARALNEQYASNPTEEYQKELKYQKEANQAYTQDYKSCFQEMLRYHPTPSVEKEGLRSFDMFELRYMERKNHLGKHGQSYSAAVDYLRALQEKLRILNSQSKKTIGTIVSVFQDVQIIRLGERMPAREGIELFLNDEIFTAPRARARIELHDRREQGNKGPTVINVGSDTHVKMEQFRFSFEEDVEIREGRIGLIKGKIRAMNTNWGARSVFSVRTGTSLCGIRGTDVVIQHDPSQDSTEYFLDHGRVEIKPQKGDKFVLTGGKMVKVQNGRAEKVQTMSTSQWKSALDNMDKPVRQSASVAASAPAKTTPAKTSQKPSGDITIQGAVSVVDEDLSGQISVTYEGCYKDKPGLFGMGRDLDADDEGPGDLLPYCLGYCSALGYKYGAAQGGNKCYCDNDFGKYGQLDESACNIPCKHPAAAEGSICGGKNANSVYRLN